GGDRLRVAVDHDSLVAEPAEALRGVDAAVVELDPLSDPVRARAEDHDPPRLACGCGLVALAPGGVVVVGAGGDLAGAGVDAPERRPDAAGATPRPRLGLARPARLSHVQIRQAEPLQPDPVVGDQLLEGAKREQRLLDADDLLL